MADPQTTRLGVCLDTPDEIWPDMTCRACAAEPEWSEELARQRIRLLCADCWEESFGRNTLDRHDDPGAWFSEVVDRSNRRQQRWLDRHRVSEHAKYRYELEAETPWLGFGPREEHYTVIADTAVIGSWSAVSGTWLWGWANSWFDLAVTRAFVPVKRLGERLGLERLWRSKFACDEPGAWELAFAALDASPSFEAIYRSPSESGSLFLAVANTRRVS